MAGISENQPAPEAPEQPAQRPQLEIDDAKVAACYANFCRVMGTPEELIIDFGLNPQPMGPLSEPLQVTQRIILNFYTAKRLLHALHLAQLRLDGLQGGVHGSTQPSGCSTPCK